jgi:hypothetical protein
MEILEIECVRGNDLLAKMKCECSKYPDDKYLSSIKNEIKFWGYNDSNFFQNVNKEPKTTSCKCGISYKYQWKQDGVHVEKAKE